nr:two-component regulator propeller domain-containing protein [Bacteroides rodentium]
MKRLQLLLLWVWMVCFSAASHDYMFKHLEVKDGLSNNQVNAIYKDSNGFMWFGTASGLNRYDGYDIKIYRSQKDNEKSIPDSYVEDIQEDASGNLWIHTGSGYAIYNSAYDVFDRNVEAWMWNVGLTGNPSLVYIDKEKTFWIYMNGKGVYSYREGQKSVVAVEESDKLVVEAEVSDMGECAEGILLVLKNGVLACIDKEKHNIKWVNPALPKTAGGQMMLFLSCLSIVADGRGYSVWKVCGFITFRRRSGNSVLHERTLTIPYVLWHRINTDVYG